MTQNNAYFVSVLKSILVVLVSALQLLFVLLPQLMSQISNLHQKIVLAKKVVLCADTESGQINGQMALKSSSMHPRGQFIFLHEFHFAPI